MCNHRRVAAATRAIAVPAVVSIILSRRNGPRAILRRLVRIIEVSWLPSLSG